MQATLAAIERSDLNCFSFVDPEQALAAAASANVALPFGGVPVGVKELESVAGWPDTGASLVFRDRRATVTGTTVGRLRDRGGAALVGMTTASEFGGLNVSTTRLNGTTHNPWRHGRTVGGSSGGSAASVSGGLVSLATGGDGGGSIRIPAGYCGLVGMKGTFGRLSRGPSAYSRPNTEVLGCLSRSVRDIARHWDVCEGTDPLDPWALPATGTWEAKLGSSDLAGLRVAVLPDLGVSRLEPGVAEAIETDAAELIRACGMTRVDLDIDLPNLSAEWMMGNISTLLADLGDLWPACSGDLTAAIEDGIRLSDAMYNVQIAAVAEKKRLMIHAAMADVFAQADVVISATNPGPAFAADSQMSRPPTPKLDRLMAAPATRYAIRGALKGVRVASGVAPKLPEALVDVFTSRFPDLVSMGALTILSNAYGNPAVSLPTRLMDGLPLGIQVQGRHHDDALILDIALAAERHFDWPRMAPPR